MSEPARFSDPRRMFEDARVEKAERRHDLHEALAGPREPKAADADLALDALVDEVVERLAHRLEQRPEAETTEGVPPTGSFDGGARATSVPPPQESHSEWLGRVLRSSAADVGPRL